MPAAINVKHIVKKFGDFTAVDDINFTVERGEIFGLLGPNGAGKSTLIRMLTTLIPPTSGTAEVDGIDVIKDPTGVRKVIGVIPQALTSDLELSVYENLLIFAKLYGVPRENRNKLIAHLLEQVELTQWAKEPVKKLSGGMRRRVEIARGLVHNPRVLFLDEPTTGLDPVSRAAVWEMVKKVKEQQELTVLLTTHYMDEADAAGATASPSSITAISWRSTRRSGSRHRSPARTPSKRASAARRRTGRSSSNRSRASSA